MRSAAISIQLPSVLSRADIEKMNRKILARRFVSVGGGLGSLAMSHLWRIAGVSDSDLCVVGERKSPSDNYERLASNSQIPSSERLRSDSGSTIDAIWGWPGYALRESISKLNPIQALRVLGEPIVSEFFTPQAGQVYSSVTRESERLGWDRVFLCGRVTAVRQSCEGGYWVMAKSETYGDIAIAAEYVHVAVGYPGIKLLPDLLAFRSKYPMAADRMVNAYEPHGHVYDQLNQHGGVVVVRGSGIVASRVLQRLLTDSEKSDRDIKVVHLFRNYVGEDQGNSRFFRRKGSDGFAYQPFNYPKSCWGGQLREKLEGLQGETRAELIDQMGGTNTAPRKAWAKQIRRHTKNGSYIQAHGSINKIEPTTDGIRLGIIGTDKSDCLLEASFVIDATGLETDLASHSLYADLLAHSGARRNPKGRLAVEDSFEITGTRSGSGRMYASGAMTLGGSYAGVDSFLGLQFAALKSVDDMAGVGAVKRIGPVRSGLHWLGWALNRSYNTEGKLI